MQSKKDLSSKERMELRAFATGMARMGRMDGRCKVHGKRIIKALELLEEHESRAKSFDSVISKAMSALLAYSDNAPAKDELIDEEMYQERKDADETERDS